MSHTRGPWAVQELDKGHNGYPGWNTFAIRSPQNVCLAVVGDVDRYHEGDHAANANLIALAPELLDALLLAVQYVGKGVADGAYDGCVMSGESALSRIEGTLKKTGRY